MVKGKNQYDVENQSKVNGNYTDGYSDSQILRQELKDAGVVPPPYSNSAHHIVAATVPEAAYARKILEKYGIELNSASNGVFLPNKKNDYVTTETMHVGSHKNSYYQDVNRAIRDKINSINRQGKTVTSSDITSVLNDIRNGLINGTVKLN